MAGLAVNPLVSKAMMLGAVQVPEELSELVDFVTELAPVNIMEIGAETGGTFYLWCHLATGIKISVDFPSGASGSGRFTGKEALAERTAEFQHWATNVRVVTGDSHQRETWDQVNDILRGEKLDFLFIDGDHSYVGVQLDWSDYRGFVRPGGYVAFHDIKDTEHHRRLGCEVNRLWAELPGVKREFCTDMHWGGIGLVRI